MLSVIWHYAKFMDRRLAIFISSFSLIVWLAFALLFPILNALIMKAAYVVLFVVIIGNLVTSFLLLFSDVRARVFNPLYSQLVSCFIIGVNVINLLAVVFIWLSYYYAVSSSTDF
jgi:hypothetical protein